MSRNITTQVSDALDDEIIKPFFAVDLDLPCLYVVRLWGSCHWG